MRSLFSRLVGHVVGSDKFLFCAIAFSFLSGIQGINWGHYACLNPDAMAFRSIQSSPPLHPGSFDKPPLLPYINNVLINEPSKIVANAAVFFGADEHNAESARWHWRTILSRLLQWVFYAGTIICAYFFARDWFGLPSARVTAVLLGTSSGFVPFKIFLTADLPLVFFMTACLCASGRVMKRPDSIGLSVAAGALAGLATAMKYNGLGVAIALPVAHFLAPGGFTAAWKRKSFYLAGIAVPLAFILANPYSVLDWGKFSADFMYNYVVTPVYGGESGTGYRLFLGRFAEIFGLPLAWMLPALVVIGAATQLRRDGGGAWRAMMILAAVFAVYFWKFGGFARVETRFVLPMAPVVLLLACPGWQWLSRWRGALPVIVAPLALYGLASGWFVGKLFADDPRMAAIDWARANMPARVKIEAAGPPAWAQLENREVDVVAIPTDVRRNRIFLETLGDNSWVKGRLGENMQAGKADFFSEQSLRARSPDFISFDSLFVSELDPSVRQFIDRLLAGELGYHVVFNREQPSPPKWVYPQNPDFTRMRFRILQRD